MTTTPTNARLKELAAQSPPPPEWFEGEEEDLFGKERVVMTNAPTDIRPIELTPADREYQRCRKMTDRLHDIMMMSMLSSFVPADVIRSREAECNVAPDTTEEPMKTRRN